MSTLTMSLEKGLAQNSVTLMGEKLASPSFAHFDWVHSIRSPFGSILHVNIAFISEAPSSLDEDRIQILNKTKNLLKPCEHVELGNLTREALPRIESTTKCILFLYEDGNVLTIQNFGHLSKDHYSFSVLSRIQNGLKRFF